MNAPVARAYERTVDALAWAGGATFVLIFVSVVLDVSLRQIGQQPPEWSVPLSEYLLLYSTMLGAPWLLRQGGHACVDLCVTRMPVRLRRGVQAALDVLCATVCALIAVVAAQSTWEAFAAGAHDVRAVLVPKALLFLPLAIGFCCLAAEFLVRARRGAAHPTTAEAA